MTDSPHLWACPTSRATGAGARTRKDIAANTRSPQTRVFSALNSVRRPASASRTYGRYAVDPPGRSLTPTPHPSAPKNRRRTGKEKIKDQEPGLAGLTGPAPSGMTVATTIALPLGLPLAIDAVDAQLKTSVWDVACRPIHRPRVWLPSRFRSSSQRRGNQACGRGDHGGTQHRSDAPDDDFSLCSRPAGHGVDHDPQHHRHRDRSTIRPDVEARCFTIGHSRSNQPASKRRPAPANFDVTSDPPVVQRSCRDPPPEAQSRMRCRWRQ